MAFEKFKDSHGGLGPLQALYSGLTEGEGLLGQWRPKVVRDRWDATFDAIRDDKSLDVDFKKQAARVRQGNYNAPQMLDIIGKVQQRAADLGTINGGVATVTGELDRLEEQSKSPADLQQISVLRTRADLARRYAVSGNPDLEKKGQEELLKLTGDLQSFTTANEAQQLQRDTLEQSIGTQNFTRYEQLSDDYRAESTPFLEQRAAYGRVKASLAQPDSAAGDIALLFNVMKVYDPGSVVREGEFATAQNMSGVPDLVLTTYNNLLRDGQRLTPAQRADFLQNVTSLYTQSQAEQVERNTRYLGRARDVGLPEAMLGNFALPIESPGDVPTNLGSPQAAAAPSPASGASESAWPQVDQVVRSIVSNIKPDPIWTPQDSAKLAGEITSLKGMVPDAAGLETNSQGMQRGVYVPRFLRKRRSTDEYPQR